MIPQRAEGDCGVSALSMFAQLAYEDVYLVAAQLDGRNRGKMGLQNREVLTIAARLGIRLTPARRYDLDDDEGVLRLRSPLHHSEGHWVAVRYALVFDPHERSATPWREYRERCRARFCTLLRGDA